MTVDEFYQWLNFIVNKEQSGAIGPDKFNLGLKVIVLDKFKEIYGLPEDYRVNQPIPRVAYELTQKVGDDLTRKFLKSVYLSVDSRGQADFPSDYAHYSTMRYHKVENSDCDSSSGISRITGITQGYSSRSVQEQLTCDGEFLVRVCRRENVIVTTVVGSTEPDRFDQGNIPKCFVEYVRDNEVPMRLCDTICPPDYDFPIFHFIDQKMQFYPIDVGEALLHYLRWPETPKRAYTMDPATDKDVYDSANSVQIELPDDTHNDIAIRLLKYWGINLREEVLVQYGLQRQAQGV